MPLKPINLKPRLKNIKKHPGKAASYAVNVIKRRWPEAEPYILNDIYWAYYYGLNIVKERWPELEKELLRDTNRFRSYIIGYAAEIIKDRWPQAENALKSLGLLKTYLNVLKGVKQGKKDLNIDII